MTNHSRHIRLAIKQFGKKHEKLIIILNSWVDVPYFSHGSHHRRERHDWQAIIDACALFGNINDKILLEKKRLKIKWTPKNLLIAKIVLHHLILDGELTPNQASKTLEKITKEIWFQKIS